MNSLFSQDFLNTSASDICDEIAKNSFFSRESILNQETIENIMNETQLFELKFNSLDISSVHDHDGYYMSNGLAKSKCCLICLPQTKFSRLVKNI